MREDEFSKRKRFNPIGLNEYELNTPKRKLLVTAAVFFIFVIISLILLYSFISRVSIVKNLMSSTLETAIKEPDNIVSPGNITSKLVSKLKTIDENSVIKVYMGINDKYFKMIPLEISKKDIIYMANADSTLTFDLAK